MSRYCCTLLLALCFGLAFALVLSAQEKSAAKPRARDLGVPFDGTPGPLSVTLRTAYLAHAADRA